MFALDFGDIDNYIATFAEDGILDIGGDKWHSITKIVLKIEDDTAYGQGDNPCRQISHFQSRQ
jgi:hypothetical protein